MPRILLRRELVADKSVHKELQYDVDGNLVLVEAWTTDTKEVKLYTTTFTYDLDGNLSVVETHHDYTNEDTTKTLVYDTGVLQTVTVEHG